MIGKNEFGEFGLNHKENVKKLTLVPDLTEFNINCISSGDGYTIYGYNNIINLVNVVLVIQMMIHCQKL